MLKRIFVAIALAVPMLAAAQTARFAVVDEKAVLESLTDYTLVTTQIAETSRQYKEEYNRMTADIDKKFEEIQVLNRQPGLAETIKERRVQELQNMQKRAQQFLMTADDDIQRQERELLEPIKERVRQAIRKVGVEEGYTFIFPIDDPLFYNTQVEDVTDAVKDALLDTQI
ncbi:MAG: OmpH family outer membrane protein [Muribaculaceae bacterium]|nr:OmpH family outer membrane protein [Muribaculaceae bacterium]